MELERVGNSRGKTLEVSVLGLMMLAEAAITIPRGAIVEFTAASLIVSAALLRGSSPRLAKLILGVGLVVTCSVPPEHVAMSVYIPVVVVLFLSQEESVVSAVVVASGGFGLGLWASRRAVTWSEWGSVASLWFTIYGLSLSIGRALRRASLQREQQHRNELAAQRRRIAAELHDTVAHDLTLMVCRAESARRSLDSAPAELARIASCGRRANEQLRFMMRLLQVEEFVRPSSLKETLGEVQQELAAEGIAVTISIDGSLGAINDRIGDCLARVLKEAGNNVIRHADRGYPCSIFVEVRQDEVHVAVRNRRSLPGRAASYGLGLDGMAQRLDMVNGTLRAGPQGTMWLVAATVPLVD